MQHKLIGVVLVSLINLGGCDENPDGNLAETTDSVTAEDCAIATAYYMNGGYYTPTQAAMYNAECGGIAIN